MLRVKLGDIHKKVEEISGVMSCTQIYKPSIQEMDVVQWCAHTNTLPSDLKGIWILFFSVPTAFLIKVRFLIN